jgi:DNA modification methylase
LVPGDCEGGGMTEPWKRKEVIGGCTLYLGDSRQILPILGRVDAIITDPPYDFVPMGGGLGAKRQVYKDIYAAGLHEGFDPALVKDGAPSIIVFCAKAQIRTMIDFAEQNSFRWNLITFNKTNPTPLCGANYLPDAEYIFHFWKGVRLGGGYADKSRFWVGPTSGDSKLHPTIKPVGLMEKLVRVSIDHPSPIILDPFMGSGTTGVACIKLGRSFIGVELDEGYFNVACKRIRDAYAQPDMFVAPRVQEMKQDSLFGDAA